MKYILTNQWKEITEKEGALPNNCVLYPILIAASATWPDANTPYVGVQSYDTQNFKAAENEKIYLRLFTNNDEAQFEVSVVTFIPEQIQNLSALGVEGKPLVAGMDFRGDQPKFYGILPEMSNQLGYGDGTTFSNGLGMDGVIVKKDGDTEGFVQIGEGYENLVLNEVTTAHSKYKKEGIFLEIETLQDISGTIYTWLNDKTKMTIGKVYTISYEVVEGKEFFDRIRTYSSSFVEDQVSITPSGFLTATCSTLDDGLLLYFKNGTPSGSKIKIKVIFSETSYPKAFIKSQAPSGRLVYNEPWSVATHSFISAGVKGSTDGEIRVYATDLQGTANNETFRFPITSHNNLKFDSVISDLFQKGFREDEVEISGAFYQKGQIENVVNLIGYKPGFKYMDTFEGFFVYEGVLTEQELKDELAKIKSNFLLPDSGVVGNIPYAKKKLDAHGNLKTHIEVDTNRDLGLLEEESMWEIIKLSDNTVSYATVKLVVDTWTITGDLDNVSGMLRAQYPCKIRRMV